MIFYHFNKFYKKNDVRLRSKRAASGWAAAASAFSCFSRPKTVHHFLIGPSSTVLLPIFCYVCFHYAHRCSSSLGVSNTTIDTCSLFVDDAEQRCLLFTVPDQSQPWTSNLRRVRNIYRERWSSYDVKWSCSIAFFIVLNRESRYLLVLTENCAALPIVEEKLLKKGDDPVIIFGSSFPKDQEYTQVGISSYSAVDYVCKT